MELVLLGRFSEGVEEFAGLSSGRENGDAPVDPRTFVRVGVENVEFGCFCLGAAGSGGR